MKTGVTQFGSAPAVPAQFVGRDTDIQNLKTLLSRHLPHQNSGVVRLVGPRLKEARGAVATESGTALTQALLAKRAGLSVELVKKAERGEPIWRSTASRLAKSVGLSLDELTASAGESLELHALIAVRGLPGVGKTTIAAKLAHDFDIKRVFEGILWASLGQSPDPLGELKAWGRALGVDIENEREKKHARARLAANLRDRRILIIIDDAWTPDSAFDLMVGGARCATLVTTRITEVADAIAPTEQDLYVLNVLTEADAVKLLSEIAASVVARHPDDAIALARELERLPLALQVAGRLLRAEERKGLEIDQLIKELRDAARLLDENSPGGPKVAALLKKSTDVLDELTRKCFAYLAPFPHKPATFDIDALQAMWDEIADDPMHIADVLIARGLLEPVGGGRFWLHALLLAHTRTVLAGIVAQFHDSSHQ